MTAPVVAPGDVICTRSTGWKARGIRFVAAIRDQPNLQNHVAVVHHLDDRGPLWCLEGKPGGVGWHTAGGYQQSPWTLTNAAQPKTDAQRKIICDGMLAMIGTEYDWEAIADDAVADVFGLRGTVAADLGQGRGPRAGRLLIPGRLLVREGRTQGPRDRWRLAPPADPAHPRPPRPHPRAGRDRACPPARAHPSVSPQRRARAVPASGRPRAAMMFCSRPPTTTPRRTCALHLPTSRSHFPVPHAAAAAAGPSASTMLLSRSSPRVPRLGPDPTDKPRTDSHMPDRHDSAIRPVTWYFLVAGAGFEPATSRVMSSQRRVSRGSVRRASCPSAARHSRGFTRSYKFNHKRACLGYRFGYPPNGPLVGGAVTHLGANPQFRTCGAVGRASASMLASAPSPVPGSAQDATPARATSERRRAENQRVRRLTQRLGGAAKCRDGYRMGLPGHMERGPEDHPPGL